MCDGELGALFHFGQRRAIRRVIEDRVVSESVITSGPIGDLAFNGADRFIQNAARVDNGYGADESCIAAAIGTLCEPLEDLGESLRIGRIWPQEARRIH